MTTVTLKGTEPRHKAPKTSTTLPGQSRSRTDRSGPQGQRPRNAKSATRTNTPTAPHSTAPAETIEATIENAVAAARVVHGDEPGRTGEVRITRDNDDET